MASSGEIADSLSAGAPRHAPLSALATSAGIDGAVAVRTRLYRDGRLVLEDFSPETIHHHLAEAGTCVWLDWYAPTKKDLSVIAEQCDLHPLAVEDALTEHERPKLDRYATHLYMSAYAVSLDTTLGRLQTSEIGAFIMPRTLITVHRDRATLESVIARWDERRELAEHGVAFMLWGLIDDIVDGHFTALQALDAEIESLESLFFAESPPTSEVQRRSYELRKSLVRFRHVVLPMREVLNALMRRDLHVLDQTIVPYYHDVYDHVLRATEWAESQRDLVTTIFENNLMLQGNRMSMAMKKVTSWAAIIAVPTAITGVYGQNVLYPGADTAWGFWMSSALIVAVSLGLYITFKRKGWL